jgi:hypothetical protein
MATWHPDQDADSESAPAATKMEVAVTEAPSGNPTMNVPAETAVQVPKWVTADAPFVANVMPLLFVLVAEDALFHVTACRVTPAYSDAPFAPVVAV